MKYLPYILAFLIISCSSPTAPEETKQFEPYTIGNWLVTSYETAEWTGKHTKSSAHTLQSDTTEITNTSNHNVNIVEDTTQEGIRFDLIFEDETITSQIFTTENIQGVRIGFDTSNPPYTANGYSYSTTPNKSTVTISSQYDCSSDQSLNLMFVNVYREDGTNYIVYKVDVSGFSDTIKRILCG